MKNNQLSTWKSKDKQEAPPPLMRSHESQTPLSFKCFKEKGVRMCNCLKKKDECTPLKMSKGRDGD